MHTTNIRHFEHDPLTVDPRKKIADRNQNMDDINYIMQHTRTSNRRANMLILVRWSDGEITWKYHETMFN